MKKVLQCPPLTQLPKLSSFIPGTKLNCGQMLLVTDLGNVTGGKLIFDVGDCFIIISEYNCNVQGLLLKLVEHISNTNWEVIMPPPNGTGKTSGLTAVTEIEGELVGILYVEKILDEISSVKIDLCVEAQEQLATDKDKSYQMMGLIIACGQKANHLFTGVAGVAN